MSASEDIRTHALKKRSADTTTPPVPRLARRVLTWGTFAGLACAEAMSSMRLFSLGEQARYPWFLAWLLPGALDVYALTMVGFFSLLAALHPLRRKAAAEAAIALVFTVLCNTLEEINEAFSAQLPPWAPNLLFVLISALAPFIAFRLIHFWAGVGNGDNPALGQMGVDSQSADNAELANETGSGTDERQPSAENETDNEPADPIGKPADNDNLSPRHRADDNPVNGKPRERQKPPVKQSAAGQPSTDTWVWIGKPVYEELRAELGKRPGETVFHGALSARVDQLIADGELVGENKDEKPDVYADPSLSTAKRIRGEIETRFPGIMFGHAAEQQDDTTEAAA